MGNDQNSLVAGSIPARILGMRWQRVMLDADLAELYGVETRALVQAVKRNVERFPADFMFQLSREEFSVLKSQSVMSKPGRGGRRTAPYAFTEQGVAMLSSVLTSARAIAVNIEIMRAFIRLRELVASHQELAKRLAELEERTEALALQQGTFAHNTRAQLKQVFEAIRQLTAPEDPPKRGIGFTARHDLPAGKSKKEN